MRGGLQDIIGELLWRLAPHKTRTPLLLPGDTPVGYWSGVEPVPMPEPLIIGGWGD